MPARGRVTLLVVSQEPALRQTYGLIFLSEHYAVKSVRLRELENTLKRIKFDVVLMDHTLNRQERKSAVRLVRQAAPAARIVALHARAHDCGADVVMDSREGVAAILDAVGELAHAKQRLARKAAS
jgi:DNA-binding response OmpR family regulator